MIKSHTKIDVSEERRILTRMIVSTEYLTQLYDIADPKLFQSPYSRTVSKWIREFFELTKNAPGKSIEDVYLKKRSEIRDEEENELIAEFLTGLSRDWKKEERINMKYATRTAEEYFKIRSIENLKNELTTAVQTNDFQLGERLIAKYSRVERTGKQGVNILTDSAAILNALSEENEAMFSFPGALGKVVGTFHRGDFFAIVGRPKIGKTWWLLYTAFRATVVGFRVLFISLEMTESPLIRRMWKCFVGRPSKDSHVKIPKFQQIKDKFHQIVINEEFKKGVSRANIEKQQKVFRRAIRSGDLRIITLPAYGASADDVETILSNYEFYEGFVPDVVVIDYADILKPVNDRLDYRHQLDQTWKKLRALASDKEILVVTGSQAGRASFKRDTEEGDVAEDYRKLAHVTKMISLNQSKKEKKDGVMRVMSLVQREEEYDDSQAVVLQCLNIGRPYVDSKMKQEVDLTKYDEKKKKTESDEDDDD